MNTRMLVGLVLMVALPAMWGAAADDVSRTIGTSGEAAIRVRPDQVVITLGVETVDKDLAKAKADNDARMQRVIAALKANDLETTAIRTDHVSIEPRYNPDLQLIGYFVRRSVIITLHDVGKFESSLSTALEAGANYVNGIQFLNTALRKHRDDARSLAIKAAREKAELLAGELNMKIGAPRQITESYNNWYSSYGYGGWGHGGQMTYQNVVQNRDTGAAIEAEATGEPFAPGQIKVSASVSVTFDLVASGEGTQPRRVAE